MIRITKQTDYGIVLLTRMARAGDRLFTAPELAESAQIPQPTVQKVLKLLARHGLLDSHRGVKGGYVLAKKPGQISVADVIAALEGPIALTECVDESPSDCTQTAFCPVRPNWQRINDVVREALQGITLKEMTQRQPSERLVSLGRAGA